MIKTSVKFSILITLLFVLINIFYIQPETRALPIQQDLVLPVEAETPAKASEQEAVLIPLVDTIASTREVNTSSEKSVTATTAVTETKVEEGTLMGAFRATAYCLRGRTASGSGVRRGIVAADPRVLPLGSRIQISAGAYSGTYVVADTGGVIKGRILDIWVPSCAEANRFGRRTITVTRIGRGAKKAKK
jgi:3D (Asp-Asp-Asp) domain-containing protein